jgi:sulfur carrier protein
MNVVINGERRVVPEGCTTAQLMAQVGIPTTGVAVAVDGAVLPRTRWQSVLAEDATIEVLTAVPGG